MFFDAFAQDAGWSGVDYDTQVEPWLGKRLGVGVDPPTGTSSPLVVVALQVTDQDTADAGLSRPADASAPAAGSQWAFSGDYALLTENPTTRRPGHPGRHLAALHRRHLLRRLTAAADDGVATAWADSSGTFKAAATSGLGSGADLGVPSGVGGPAGRSTMVARFDGPDAFELERRATGDGAGGWILHQVNGNLPARPDGGCARAHRRRQARPRRGPRAPFARDRPAGGTRALLAASRARHPRRHRDPARAQPLLAVDSGQVSTRSRAGPASRPTPPPPR